MFSWRCETWDHQHYGVRSWTIEINSLFSWGVLYPVIETVAFCSVPGAVGQYGKHEVTSSYLLGEMRMG